MKLKLSSEQVVMQPVANLNARLFNPFNLKGEWGAWVGERDRDCQQNTQLAHE